jgi:hypothetical protein
MTDKITALKEMLAKVEAGDWGLIKDGRAPLDEFGDALAASHAYHGSLDAAKKLHEAVVPDWEWIIYYDGDVGVQQDGGVHHYEQATNPITSRAWLIAIIKALIWEAER